MPAGSTDVAMPMPSSRPSARARRLRTLEGREAVGHVSENAKAVARVVVQGDLEAEIDELGVAAAGFGVPIAHPRAADRLGVKS